MKTAEQIVGSLIDEPLVPLFHHSHLAHQKILVNPSNPLNP
jgi:hypothetical protein